MKKNDLSLISILLEAENNSTVDLPDTLYYFTSLKDFAELISGKHQDSLKLSDSDSTEWNRSVSKGVAKYLSTTTSDSFTRGYPASHNLDVRISLDTAKLVSHFGRDNFYLVEYFDYLKQKIQNGQTLTSTEKKRWKDYDKYGDENEIRILDKNDVTKGYLTDLHEYVTAILLRKPWARSKFTSAEDFREKQFELLDVICWEGNSDLKNKLHIEGYGTRDSKPRKWRNPWSKKKRATFDAKIQKELDARHLVPANAEQRVIELTNSELDSIAIIIATVFYGTEFTEDQLYDTLKSFKFSRYALAADPEKRVDNSMSTDKVKKTKIKKTGKEGKTGEVKKHVYIGTLKMKDKVKDYLTKPEKLENTQSVYSNTLGTSSGKLKDTSENSGEGLVDLLKKWTGEARDKAAVESGESFQSTRDYFSWKSKQIKNSLAKQEVLLPKDIARLGIKRLLREYLEKVSKQ